MALEVLTADHPNDPASPEGVQLAVDRGILVYGNFVFPPATTTTFQVKPVYNEGRRFADYYMLDVQAKFVVTKDTWSTKIGNDDLQTALPLNEKVRDITNILMQPRQQLVLHQKGYGSWWIKPEVLSSEAEGELPFEVRSTLTDDGVPETNDYGDGPLPDEEGVSWTPLNQNAVMGTWRCTAIIAPCELGELHQQVLPAEISYTLEFSQNDGSLQAKVSGSFPTYRYQRELSPNQYTRAILKAADILSKAFPQPDNVKRTWDHIAESSDKRTCTFSFTDEWFTSPHAYEKGMLKFDIDYSVETGLNQGGWTIANCTLTGDIEVHWNYPKHWGYLSFLRVFEDLIRPERRKSKYRYVYEDVVINGQPPYSPYSVWGKRLVRIKDDDARPLQTLLKRIRVSESRFSRKLSVELNWIVQGVTPAGLIHFTGILLQGRTGSSWLEWRRSLESNGDSRFGLNPFLPNINPFFAEDTHYKDLSAIGSDCFISPRPPESTPSGYKTGDVGRGGPDDDLGGPYGPFRSNVVPGAIDKPSSSSNNPPPPKSMDSEKVSSYGDAFRFQNTILTEEVSDETVFASAVPVTDPEAFANNSNVIASVENPEPARTGSSPNALTDSLGRPLEPLEQAQLTVRGSHTPYTIYRNRGHILTFNAPAQRPVLKAVKDSSGQEVPLIALKGGKLIQDSRVEMDIDGRPVTMYFLGWDQRYVAQTPNLNTGTESPSFLTNYPFTSFGVA